MKKVYVKFGEPLDDESHIYVYEGILEDNIIKLTLPSLSYSSCQTVAKDMEMPAYLVEGKYIGQSNNGQPALREYKIISKLTFDKNKECFVYNETVTEKKDETVEEAITAREMIAQSTAPRWFKALCNFGLTINGDYNRPGSKHSNLSTFKKK